MRNRLMRSRAALRTLRNGDAVGGVLLIAVAVLAIAIANSGLRQGYAAILHHALPWTPVAELTTLHLWINDGLMAAFFMVVGLEIKREAVVGALADPRRRRLPVIAAIAGIATPALCFLAIAGRVPLLQRGWAIPGATDIAFAVGVLALLGGRAPPTLRLFLLTVAIVDDLGAVAVIALFYTASISIPWLVAALVVWLAMLGCARLRVAAIWPYLALAIGLWLCVLHSGVHATVAGVLAGLAIPLTPDGEGTSPLLRLEHRLQPWTRYLIVPLFGFANAGLTLGGGVGGLAAPLPLAIAVGLFAGKQLGVFGAIVVAERCGLAMRPEGASWPQVWGVSILCGIGFTMSLFIANLAFADQPASIEQAKLGVIAGSSASIVLGYAVLWLYGRRRQTA